MASNYSFISCLLLLIVIPTALSAVADENTGDHYVDQICEPTSETFTSDSQYATNLNNLLNDLVTNTSSNNGFMTTSSKLGTNESEYAYGHALCRQDVSPESCNQCLNSVSSTIKASCSSKEATIWHYHCFLTYSNQNDSSRGYPMHHKENESGESNIGKTLGLFYTLVGEIASNQPDTMFASGNATYGNETVYAMVQCTRDQSVVDCTNCLALTTARGISFVSSIAKGGTVFSGKCIDRFEMFPFLLN